jgi:hypothetical protein
MLMNLIWRWILLKSKIESVYRLQKQLFHSCKSDDGGDGCNCKDQDTVFLASLCGKKEVFWTTYKAYKLGKKTKEYIKTFKTQTV